MFETVYLSLVKKTQEKQNVRIFNMGSHENLATKEYYMRNWTFTIVLLVLLFAAVFAYTHSGGLDDNGGHTDSETGVYHIHRETNEDTTSETILPAIPYLVPDFTQDIAYKVIRIVDGDTVVISYEGVNTTVRLIGVDTPETRVPNNPEEEEHGKKASMFIQNLLQGESVYLRFDAQNTTDRYGRMLAYLYRAPDGLFVNLELVRQGYGLAYTQFPFEHIDLFRHYGERARLAEKGLWKDQTVGEEQVEEYDPADVNGDGVVNVLDLVTVANAMSNN